MRFITALLLMLLAATAAQAQSYSVHPGDVLKIEVLEDPSLNRDVLVGPDGQFTFPLAGSIQAGGRSVGQISAALVQKLSSNYATPPNVYVSLSRLAPPTVSTYGAPTAGPTITVYILGEANSPGKHDVAPGTTLLQFMAEAGGLTKFAATKRIQLRHRERTGAEEIYTFNLKAVESGQHIATPYTLRDGDVVVVPQRRLFE